jgi:hypothetical protein
MKANPTSLSPLVRSSTSLRNLSSLRVIPLCVSVLMLGACASRTVERQVVHEQPIIQQAPAQPAERVVVMTQPASPQEDITPSPGPGYAWVAGHYVWRDGWNWERGQWVSGSARPMPAAYAEAPSAAPTSDARWVPGYWDYVGNDWQWKKGHWEAR